MSEIREKVIEKLTERAMQKWNVGPSAVNGMPQPSCLEEALGKEWKAEAWKVYLANTVMNASLAFMGLCTITYFLFLPDYNFYYELRRESPRL